MNKKVLFFIAILVLLSTVTTFIYYHTQQEDIYCYQGNRYFRKGEYEQAIKYCEKVLAINPQRLEALNDLGYSHLWTGNYEKAIECFQKILSLKPEDNKIKVQLAETYAWNKEYEESMYLYRGIIEDTDDIEVRKKLARVCMWNGDFDLAKKELEIILQENPKEPKARLLLAKVMHYSGEAEKAVEVYEELLEEEMIEEKKEEEAPEPEEIKELLGEAYMISEDYKSAIKQYKEILAKDPDNIKVRIELADILNWEKKYDEAISEYEKALEIGPDNLEIKEKLSNIYVWKKDYKKAEILYKEILQENPEKLDIYASLAQILTWEKRYTEAIYYFDLALSKKEDENMRFLYGEALLSSGDYKRAQEVLRGIIEKDPANLKAKEYLADTYAYSKEFDEAIALYSDILNQEKNLEVKNKLADVLSWAKYYQEALDLYDEILSEKYDVKVQWQKARVLGWARRYNDSLKEYQNILDREYNEIVELEMESKKAYWGNRVKGAIRNYKELIEKDPANVESMFDLSQIYSYQSMWEEAINEYRRVLAVSPNHFRAKEALEKAQLIASHISLKAGYEYFDAESKARDTDINKHILFGILTFPVNYHLVVDFIYKHTWRTFTDFRDIYENEGSINFTYLKKPNWWINGFYDFIAYNRSIDPINTFGGNINFRIFDMGILTLLYNKERLENSSTVIREGYYKDNFFVRLFLDCNKRLKLGIDYLFSDYSDDNRKNEPGLDILYYVSLEPRRFTLKYRFFYKEFEDTVDEYFSPDNFCTHQLSFNWRHFLNKEEVFFGADDLYYGLAYAISVDSENVVGHKFSGEFNWDINKRVNFNIKGTIVNSSNSVYKDKSLVASVKIYF